MYVGHNMFVCVICVYCVCESRQSMGMQICFALPSSSSHMFKCVFFMARAVTTVLIGSSTVILVCLSLLSGVYFTRYQVSFCSRAPKYIEADKTDQLKARAS